MPVAVHIGTNCKRSLAEILDLGYTENYKRQSIDRYELQLQT